MFWNPEVITTTGKSLRITQILFNLCYTQTWFISHITLILLFLLYFKLKKTYPSKFHFMNQYRIAIC